MNSDFRSRINNFDLLRLLAAFAVMLVHTYSLSRSPELERLFSFLSTAVAVKVFFIISGYLIFRSYERSSDIHSYMQKRVRRICPAYFTVVCFFAVALFFVGGSSLSEYLSL